MHSIGCAAKVVEITNTYDDGRMDIIVEGIYRYSLIELEPTDKPYAVGNVMVHADEMSENTDSELLAGVSSTYNLVVTMVFGSQAPTFSLGEFSDTPSFDMAPKCGLSNEQKQELISLQSENKRLALLQNHLGQLLPAMRRADQVKQFIQRDGYLRAMPT